MANQYVLDPRQSLALASYKNPTSPTFGNLKQSLIASGYDDEYANSIAGREPAWLLDGMKSDVQMIQRAERNLNRYNTLDIKLDTKNNIDIAKLQVDVSKFILKTLAKQKYNDGDEVIPASVQINIVNYNKDKAPSADDPARVVDSVASEPVADGKVQAEPTL
jgi:hypothetical protein